MKHIHITVGFTAILSSIILLSVSFLSVVSLSCKPSAGSDDSFDTGSGGALSAIAEGGTVKFANTAGTLTGTPNADSVWEIHLFPAVGNHTLTVNRTAAVSATAIAGGGGGGRKDAWYAGDYSGGGGAGGVIQSASMISAGTYTVTVGAGGNGGSANNIQGFDGEDTMLTTSSGAVWLIAYGGGGGGAGIDYYYELQGREGGSGGGGGNGRMYNAGWAGPARSDQGFPGGAAVSDALIDPGAGGGGAGGPGQDSAVGGGAGGPGIELELLSLVLEKDPTTRYAAGGKGGGQVDTPALNGVNYGDGGGGPNFATAPGSGTVPGCNGHSGVLLLSFPYPPPGQ